MEDTPTKRTRSPRISTNERRSITCGKFLGDEEEKQQRLLKKRKFERQDGVKLLNRLQWKQMELFEIFGADIEDEERIERLGKILRTYYERGNQNPTASILSNVEECFEDISDNKFEQILSLSPQFVRDLAMKMEIRSNCEDMWVFERGEITFEQVILCWFLIMRTGKIEGMVQNDEYFTMSEVKHMFLTFTERFLQQFEGEMLLGVPNELKLAGIEREFGRRGMPGCVGLLHKFNIRHRVPTIGKKKNTNETETMYCETWSDANGVCWAWDTIERSKPDERRAGSSTMIEAISKGEISL